MRCYKVRIARWHATAEDGAEVLCLCGKRIGIDEGDYIKMIGNAFTYTGTKRNR